MWSNVMITEDTRVSFGEGEQFRRITLAVFPKSQELSSMDRLPAIPSDWKPELSVHAKARSRADSDLLAVIAVKGKK